jgi:hypothetical protein
MKQLPYDIDEYGTKRWINDKGLLHREDGPALEYAVGNKSWFVGKRPRYIWYVNGQLHRLDGPAVEWNDGSKEWYVNGKRHRLDGPAEDWREHRKVWWINGKECSEQDFPIAVIQFLLYCDRTTAKIILKLL